jgi:predicted lysophospholipase L1 biosynthesis ABC-type transport system permease subunit
VTESFARHFFEDDNPIGRIVTLEPDSSFEVVGLVRDMRVEGVREQPRRWMYLAALQAERELWSTRFVVRTSGPPQRSFESFRRMIREENAQLPIVSINTDDELLGRTVDRDRLLANLAVAFGVLSLLIAAVGIYGLLSYDVVKRTQEVGVRMALGAKRGGIVRLVLRETTLMCAIGIVAGTAAALACGRYVESLLFGLHPNDPRHNRRRRARAGVCGFTRRRRTCFPAGSVSPVAALRYD